MRKSECIESIKTLEAKSESQAPYFDDRLLNKIEQFKTVLLEIEKEEESESQKYSVCQDCYFHIGAGNHSEVDECFEPEKWEKRNDEIADAITREIENVEDTGKAHFICGQDSEDESFSRFTCDLCRSDLAGSRHSVAMIIVG